MRQYFSLLGAAVAASLVAAPAADAQEKGPAAAPQEAPAAVSAPAEKRAIEASDYAQWERLGYASELSPDGRWLAYTVSTVGGEGELRLRMLATDSTEVFENGTRPEFTANSNWLGFVIGVSEAEREKLAKAKKPVRYDLSLHNLVTGETSEVAKVSSFEFSDDGKYLIMRRYAPKGGEGHGADIVLRDLATGVDTNFGNVGSYSWNDDGTLLAMIIDAEDQAGNGIQLYDACTGLLRTLDSADETYKQMTWREDSADLAVLREKTPEEDSEEDEKKKGEDDEEVELTHDVLTWRGLDEELSTRRIYDAAKDEGFPRTMRIVDSAGLRWSDDGATLFFGLKELENPPEDEPEEAKPVETEKPEKPEAPEEPEKPTETPKPTEPTPDQEVEEAEKPEQPKEAPAAAEKDEAAEGTEKSKKGEKKPEKDAPKSLRETLKDPAGVEVWHTKDIDIIPRQKKTAGSDRRKSFLAAWWLEDGSLVQLGSDLTERVRPLEGQKHAIGRDNTPYEEEKRYGPTMVDVYLIDARTGESQKICERLKYAFGSGPGGRYVLYIKDGHFWSYDREAAQHRNLTVETPTHFIDQENSSLTDEKPPYGICAWSADGESVYLYDRFDIYCFRADGSDVKRLTRGAEKEIRYRRVVLDYEEDEFVDPTRSMYLSLYGEQTKKSGYARMLPGDSPQTLLFEEKAIGRLSKAEEAEIYSYVSQSYDDSPDFFVTGPELVKPRQATETNPWQDDYLWGRTELVDYQNVHGEAMQGALIYPANYEPGTKYPMIVYIYEELSQTLHSYSAPTETHPYNPAVFSAQGYFVFKPDIVYRPQNPGVSAKECLEPAVKKVLESGMVDAEKVGLVGHSWGAYQTAFMVTHSDVFAAGVAGAPLTNMMSMSGSIYWNSGQSDSWIFHESQGRMDTPFWKDVETYINNSPIFGIENLNAPLLIAFGDEDGAVDWNQGVEMYNAARLAQKPLVMLVYAGENHGLSKKPNQVDYHYRVLEWFNHYLRGDEAPAWITEGQSYLDRQKEIDELKKKGGKDK